jgi:hypothetical protein
MRHDRGLLALVIVTAIVEVAAAQGNPTGVLRGEVRDPDNLALPGVTVKMTSPALQGARTAVTSSNGDFIIPFLPPGEYVVTFELQGFKSERRTMGVAMAETVPLEIKMAVAPVSETVIVILKTGTVAETYKSEALERLPVGRTLTDAVLLAPGAANNGPMQSDGTRNIIMSGALSYENLFLVNGVTVNENLRGQPLLLYIEDAIQETRVSHGSISAEYGRFQGGVVNMITKSGGNAFSGSFRTSFTNDAWRALTPFPGDQTVNSLTPTYEVTGGGPILKDRIWFFGAGRFTNPLRNQTLSFTGGNYLLGTDDKRGEGKVTYALTPGNNLKASYTKRRLATTNNSSAR